MLYETHYEADKVELLFEGDARTCMLRIENVPSGVVTVDGTFPNARMLSAQLRDSIGFQGAKILLNYWGISPNSDLWDLNHDRPYKYLPSLVRGGEEVDDRSNLPSSDWLMIAETTWSNFDEGGVAYLYEHAHDRRLGILESSSGPYGTSEEFEEGARYSQWLAIVDESDAVAEAMDSFEGTPPYV